LNVSTDILGLQYKILSKETLNFLVQVKQGLGIRPIDEILHTNKRHEDKVSYQTIKYEDFEY
jgi:hypothetical protein